MIFTKWKWGCSHTPGGLSSLPPTPWGKLRISNRLLPQARCVHLAAAPLLGPKQGQLFTVPARVYSIPGLAH